MSVGSAQGYWKPSWAWCFAASEAEPWQNPEYVLVRLAIDQVRPSDHQNVHTPRFNEDKELIIDT